MGKHAAVLGPSTVGLKEHLAAAQAGLTLLTAAAPIVVPSAAIRAAAMMEAP